MLKTDDYQKYLYIKEQEFENLCIKCGICCGITEDPCSKLAKNKDETYYCTNYENRLGPQYTIGSNSFNCITIKEIFKKHHGFIKCGYYKYFHEKLGI